MTIAPSRAGELNHGTTSIFAEQGKGEHEGHEGDGGGHEDFFVNSCFALVTFVFPFLVFRPSRYACRVLVCALADVGF